MKRQDEVTSSVSVHVLIDGRVQGVGFRYATQREAQSLGLNGWVRNLPDGQVEAVFEGPREDLDAMLEWCEQGPSFARVTSVKVTWKHDAPAHAGFHIRG